MSALVAPPSDSAHAHGNGWTRARREPSSNRSAWRSFTHAVNPGTQIGPPPEGRTAGRRRPGPRGGSGRPHRTADLAAREGVARFNGHRERVGGGTRGGQGAAASPHGPPPGREAGWFAA